MCWQRSNAKPDGEISIADRLLLVSTVWSPWGFVKPRAVPVTISGLKLVIFIVVSPFKMGI